MPAKRHHLLPRLYINRWADADGQVRLVDTEGDRSFIANVNDAIVRNGFYNIETDDGTPPDIIEQAIAQVEGYAATGFAALDTGIWPLDAESRTALAHFIALQIPRGESFRATTNRAFGDVAKMMLQSAASDPQALRRLMREIAGGVEPTDEEVTAQADFMLSDDLVVTPSQTSSVALFLEAAGELVESVFACSWDLVTATGDARFITADEPIMMWRAPGAAPAWMGVGIATADEITLPLDPKRALTFRARMGAPDGQFPGPDQIVEIINGRTAQAAHRFLVLAKDWAPARLVLPADG